MKIDAYLQDPVFQLNLLLWMAIDQPSEHYCVRPVFKELGFGIIYVEQPFKFPQESLNAILASGLDIAISPEPDAIFGRMSDNKALYFEAKANSFSETSTNSRQANGHLMATGPAFGEVFNPLSSCLLCYLLPDEERHSMGECLAQLAQGLTRKCLRPGTYSVHGLLAEGAELVYTWDTPFQVHVGTTELRASILSDLTEDTDPSPLLLVYSDEDCSNTTMRDMYRRAFLEQVRASLLCDLHSSEDSLVFSTTIDSLLDKATNGVIGYVGRQRQKSLRHLIRANVFLHIRDYWQVKQPGSVVSSSDTLTIKWRRPEERLEFLSWLEDRRRRFSATRPVEKPPDPQMSLLSMDEDIEESQ